MQRVTVSQAQSDLPTLIEAAVNGETVLIMNDDQQAVQLVPLTAKKQKRHAGSGKGTMTIADDFDAPLPDFQEYMG
jgi:antitoxin (DNA-binding transcriptional repressor) of toxin-antitoxin stability system